MRRCSRVVLVAQTMAQGLGAHLPTRREPASWMQRQRDDIIRVRLQHRKELGIVSQRASLPRAVRYKYFSCVHMPGVLQYGGAPLSVAMACQLAQGFAQVLASGTLRT